MKVLKWLDLHFEEALLITFLVLISCIELVQVVARNTPILSSLTWAEEICRFLWIATAFLSLPYTLRNETILRVTAVGDLLPWKARNILDVCVDALNVLILAILSYYSISVIQTIYVSGELSPAVLLPMWIVYVFVVAGLWLGTFRACQMLYIHIRHVNVPKTSSVEEAAKLEMAGNEELVNELFSHEDKGAAPAAAEPATAAERSDA